MRRRDFLGASLPTLLALNHERTNADERARAADFDPTELDIATLQEQLGGNLNSAALVTAYFARIARLDASGPRFRSVIAVNPEALEHARMLDAERRSGKIRGPLHGIPILVKDNIATRDPLPTTAGSLALANAFHRVDAPLVARLRAAGAIVLGKTNLSEWANFRSTLSSSGWSAVGGQTGNPYDPARNPSGSSSGSATAAALSFCAVSIGTETDGSILSPSALCGLVGLKPTLGAVSGAGIVPISPRQDVAGPMARTVADALAVASVIYEQPRVAAAASVAPSNEFRIGICAPPDSIRKEAKSLYLAAIDVWRRTSVEVVDAVLPRGFRDAGNAEFTALLYEFKAAIDNYLGDLSAEQTSVRSLAELVEFNRRNAERELALFGQEIFEMALDKGSLTDKTYLDAIAELRERVDVLGLETLFRELGVDVLVAPGNGPAALIDPVLGDRRDGGGSSLGSAAAIAGYPSLTLPIGLVKGLPVGMTLVAPRHAEDRLLRIAARFEREGQLRVPPRYARS